MGYETKVILKAVYETTKRCETVEEALKAIADMANIEGVILGAAEQERAKKKETKTTKTKGEK